MEQKSTPGCQGRPTRSWWFSRSTSWVRAWLQYEQDKLPPTSPVKSAAAS